MICIYYTARRSGSWLMVRIVGWFPPANAVTTVLPVIEECGKVDVNKYRARLKSSVKKLAKPPREGFFLRFFAEKNNGWVAELADAGDLKSLASNGVRVRAPP